jgi:hypothetical protein
MLAAPEDEMAGTMSFASLTDAVAVERETTCVHCWYFFLMVTLLLKRSKYFASISILLVKEKFLGEIPYSYG